MEITTVAKELKDLVDEKQIKELELFFVNSNLSNQERSKMVDIIKNMLQSNAILFLKENGL